MLLTCFSVSKVIKTFLFYSILKIEQRFELKMRLYTTFCRWQQQSFRRNPLVVRRNFKYVKVSGVLLAIYILGFCYTVIAEPISTIDASSSIPGKIYCIFVYNLYSSTAWCIMHFMLQRCRRFFDTST